MGDTGSRKRQAAPKRRLAASSSTQAAVPCPLASFSIASTALALGEWLCAASKTDFALQHRSHGDERLAGERRFAGVLHQRVQSARACAYVLTTCSSVHSNLPKWTSLIFEHDSFNSSVRAELGENHTTDRNNHSLCAVARGNSRATLQNRKKEEKKKTEQKGSKQKQCAFGMPDCQSAVQPRRQTAVPLNAETHRCGSVSDVLTKNSYRRSAHKKPAPRLEKRQ